MTFYNYSNVSYGDYLFIVVSALSVSVLLITVLKSKINCGGYAEKYDFAAKRCYKAKSCLSLNIEKYELDSSSVDPTVVLEEIDRLCEDIEPIPEKLFLKLKYLHKKKKALSKFIEADDSVTWNEVRSKFAKTRK